MKKEGVKLKGTPIATTTTFDVVKTKEQIDAETSNQKSSGGGGLGGMLARKIAKQEPRSRARRCSPCSTSTRKSRRAWRQRISTSPPASRKRSNFRRRNGQVDGKGRPLPFPTVRVDPAPTLLHDPVDRRQPEAGPLPLFLRREEQLEDVRTDVVGHSMPVSCTDSSA